MKKLLPILVSLLFVFALSACESNDYVGTYIKSDSGATYTVKLGNDYSFKYTINFIGEVPPYFENRSTVITGTYKIDGDKITIIYRITDPVGGTEEDTTTAYLSGKTLKISGIELGGDYIKK